MRKFWKRHSWYILLALIGILLIILTVTLTKVDNEPVVIKDEPIITTAPIPTIPTVAVVVEDEPTEDIEETEAVEEPFYYDVPLGNDVQDFIRARCCEYGVEMDFVMAIIEAESSFRADLYSGTNDVGLMQINKCNHEWLKDELGVDDFTDPMQNALCGIHIIAGHLDKTNGDKHLALMRYNCGAAGAKRLWDKGIYSSKYSRKVVGLYEEYKAESTSKC